MAAVSPETAAEIVKDVRRARAYIESLTLDARVDAKSKAALVQLDRFLAVQVLAPLERVNAAKAGAAPRPLGRRAAYHLVWADDEAQRRVIALVKTSSEQPGVFRTYQDLLVEIGGIGKPAYAAYPDLWRSKLRQPASGEDRRTAQSDDALRKASPPADSVTLSPAALAKAREYMRELGKGLPGCQMAAFNWYMSEETKKPGDDSWTVSGPGVGFGSYDCRKIPPDIVRTIDGVRLIVLGDTPQRFAGKRIDWDGKHFVLQDR